MERQGEEYASQKRDRKARSRSLDPRVRGLVVRLRESKDEATSEIVSDEAPILHGTA